MKKTKKYAVVCCFIWVFALTFLTACGTSDVKTKDGAMVATEDIYTRFVNSDSRTEKLTLLKKANLNKDKSRMKAYFIDDYNKILQDNTLENLDNITDTEVISNSLENLSNLLALITSEKNSVMEDSEYEAYTDSINYLTESYNNRIKSLTTVKATTAAIKTTAATTTAAVSENTNSTANQTQAEEETITIAPSEEPTQITTPAATEPETTTATEETVPAATTDKQ